MADLVLVDNEARRMKMPPEAYVVIGWLSYFLIEAFAFRWAIKGGKHVGSDLYLLHFRWLGYLMKHGSSATLEAGRTIATRQAIHIPVPRNVEITLNQFIKTHSPKPRQGSNQAMQPTP